MSSVFSAVSKNLLSVPKDVGYFHFIPNEAHWSEEFRFEIFAEDWQGLLSGWPNIERFNMMVTDRFRYYYKIPS